MSVHAISNPQEFATKEHCEQLRLFIIQYAADHQGQTPTIDLMVREMRAPEDSVRFILQKLERVGHILIISRNPLRIIVKTPGLNPLAGTDHRAAGALDRFLDAEGTRHRLGRFIGQTEATTGRGPTLRQMMAFLQYDNPGWVHRACEILADRGLVTMGNGTPVRLTTQGREFYGIKSPPAPAAPVVVLVPVQKKKELQVECYFDEIGTYLWNHRDRPPNGNAIGKALRHGNNLVYQTLAAMAEQGLIEPRPRGSKKRPILTKLGRERFGTARRFSTSSAAPPLIAEQPAVAIPDEEAGALDNETLARLTDAQNKLAEKYGFTPTLAQTVQALLHKAAP